jgi:alpha-ketoglutarate-dependent taurine dioxygenase
LLAIAAARLWIAAPERSNEAAMSQPRIAIIGGGSAGLTFARVLRKNGAEATIFKRDQSQGERGQGGSLDLHLDSGQFALRYAARYEGQGTLLYDKAGRRRRSGDTTFRESPSMGSILCMTHTPARGGDTMWADMSAAYDDLDGETQSFLSGLGAIHDWELFRKRMLGKMAAEQIEELNRKFPPVEHPVIRTHPVSGRKIVYVNVNFTMSIKGMSDSESTALLQRLYDLPKTPEYQVRLRWRPGTIAFWDNRSTQHRVVNDVVGYRRAERVTIVGDRPF